MTHDLDEISSLMLELERVLRQSGQWEPHPPSSEALGSIQPFSCDTLHLTQWLQWVFLPRMRMLLESAQPLPGKCDILPYAQEQLREAAWPVDGLLRAIASIDRALSD